MIKLTKSTKFEEGSCRGCHSKDDEVFVISAGEFHVTSVQVCYSCLTDLVGQIPRRRVTGDGDVAFANGKSAFARGATYEDNPYRGDNDYLADQWGHGWVSAQVDSEAKTLRE